MTKPNNGMQLPKMDIDRDPVCICPNDIDKADFTGLSIDVQLLINKRKLSGRSKPFSFWGK